MENQVNSTIQGLLNVFEYSNFTFYYKGSFRKDIVLELIDLIEYNTTGELNRKFSKRVSVLIAESIQNIEKYGNPDYFEDEAFIFALNNYISIVTSNKITTTEADALKEQLDAINNREGEELESYFDHLIKNNPLKNQASAGLGLVQMKRKAERNLEYEFEDLGSNMVRYKLAINFPIEENFGDDEKTILHHSKNKFQTLRELFRDHSGIFYKGKFSNKAMIPILKLLQNYLTSASSRFNLDSMQYHIIIEMIQNVSKHNSSEKDGKGIFLIRKGVRGSFDVATANMIEEEDSNTLDQHFKMLLDLSQDQLVEYCNNKMKEKFEQGSTGAGIGIPNIIRYSSPGKLKYEFFRKTKKLFFYLETKFD